MYLFIIDSIPPPSVNNNHNLNAHFISLKARVLLSFYLPTCVQCRRLVSEIKRRKFFALEFPLTLKDAQHSFVLFEQEMVCCINSSTATATTSQVSDVRKSILIAEAREFPMENFRKQFNVCTRLILLFCWMLEKSI